MSKPKKSKKHEIIEYPATQEEARRVGSPFFRTAELCPAQHFEEERGIPRQRFTSTGECVACRYGTYGCTETYHRKKAEYQRNRRALGLAKPRKSYSGGLSTNQENVRLMPPWLSNKMRREYGEKNRKKLGLRIDHYPIPRNRHELIHWTHDTRKCRAARARSGAIQDLLRPRAM